MNVQFVQYNMWHRFHCFLSSQMYLILFFMHRINFLYILLQVGMNTFEIYSKKFGFWLSWMEGNCSFCILCVLNFVTVGLWQRKTIFWNIHFIKVNVNFQKRKKKSVFFFYISSSFDIFCELSFSFCFTAFFTVIVLHTSPTRYMLLVKD